MKNDFYICSICGRYIEFGKRCVCGIAQEFMSRFPFLSQTVEPVKKEKLPVLIDLRDYRPQAYF